MNTLYCDIGNTNISCLFNGSYTSFSTQLIFETNFLEHFPSVRKIVCASVVPKAEAKLQEICQSFGIEFCNIKIEDIDIVLNIENPQELGIDRAINAVSALKKFGKNVIIIDFGTALTFDIVHNAIYDGGMIFPGLAMAMHNLHTKTAKLPDVKITQYTTGIGKNTISAIQNSACIGYGGVIKEHINFIQSHYKAQFKVVFTGGSGKLFWHIIPESVFEENLILEYLMAGW